MTRIILFVALCAACPVQPASNDRCKSRYLPNDPCFMPICGCPLPEGYTRKNDICVVYMDAAK